MDIEKIKELTQIIVEEAIKKLRTSRMLKDSYNVYQKTEIILNNYCKYKEAIKSKDEAIEEIKEYGRRQGSAAFVQYNKGTSKQPTTDEEIIEIIKRSKERTVLLVKQIDCALKQIKKRNKYYKILEYRYLVEHEEDKKTLEEISEIMEIDISTITRNNKKMINELAILLFADEALDEILGSEKNVKNVKAVRREKYGTSQ